MEESRFQNRLSLLVTGSSILVTPCKLPRQASITPLPITRVDLAK